VKKAIHKYFNHTPLVFPLVLLFHLAMLLHAVWLYREESFDIKTWQHPLLLLFFTVLWAGVCILKKIFAYGYIFITSITLIYSFLIAPKYFGQSFEPPFFPLDILCCFFILVYFRKFS